MKLISTDFDGTLIDPAANCPEELIDLLGELKRAGVVWAINTGRTLEHTLEGLRECSISTAPDFVLANERDIFCPSNGREGWKPLDDWNRRSNQAHHALHERAAPVLTRIHDFIRRETGAEPVIEDRKFMGVIGRHVGEMDAIVEVIVEYGRAIPELAFQRNEVFLRFCHADYHKGAVLGEVSRKTGIPADDVFAVGDNHNDLDMLDGRFARLVACPANSVEEVKTSVRNASGYISPLSYGEGVRDALLHYRNGGASR